MRAQAMHADNTYPCTHTHMHTQHTSHPPRSLPSAVGLRVCDAGCGTGLFLPLFAQAVGRRGSVVGIDSSEGAITAVITLTLTLTLASILVVDLKPIAMLIVTLQSILQSHRY